MAKTKKSDEKPADDLVYDFETETLVRARLLDVRQDTTVAHARILTRKPFQGKPLYWLMPMDRSIPLQHVQESDILGRV